MDFFDEEDVNLYAVLGLESTATQEGIKKAYRKSALIYHPDKHVSSTEDAKQAASRKFQQVGFAYAVLGDKKRRAKYDATGSTEDGFDLAEGEDGWEAYFEALFESVTRNKLDQLKKEYQGEGPFPPTPSVPFHSKPGRRLARGARRPQGGVRRDGRLAGRHHDAHPALHARRRGALRARHLGPDRGRRARCDGRVEEELAGRKGEARPPDAGRQGGRGGRGPRQGTGRLGRVLRERQGGRPQGQRQRQEEGGARGGRGGGPFGFEGAHIEKAAERRGVPR